MAHILCIETATGICSVAVAENGQVLAEKTLSEGQRHSSMLAVLIQECISDLKLEMTDIDAVAVSDGPGSYTGLRVGTSTAKGICYALDVPLIAVSTLKSLASRHKGTNAGCIAPMIDARRMEVYTALFNENLGIHRDTYNLILTQETLDEIIDHYGSVLVCGDGAYKCCKHFSGTPGLICYPDDCNATLLAGLAQDSFVKREFQNIAYYRPFYFKKPNITKGKTYFPG